MMKIRLSFALPALAIGLLGMSAAVLAQSASPYPMPPPAAADGAAAAAGAHAGHHHRNKIMRALKTLDLSDAQKAQIKDVVASYRSSRSTSTPMTRGEMRRKIEATLTPAQRTQFEAQMARRRRVPAGAAPDESPAPTR